MASSSLHTLTFTPLPTPASEPLPALNRTLLPLTPPFRPCQVVQLLADELLRSKGGRPVAVRHLEDAAGGEGLLAVQLQVTVRGAAARAWRCLEGRRRSRARYPA